MEKLCIYLSIQSPRIIYLFIFSLIYLLIYLFAYLFILYTYTHTRVLLEYKQIFF